jgi:iron complex outermembrane recepter protein
MKSVIGGMSLGAWLGAAGAALLTGTAWAANARDDVTLEEIVVTATRIQTDVQKTPVAVNVYSNEQLLEANIHDVLALQSIDPSLNITQNGNQAAIALRGVTNTNLTELGNPTVASGRDNFYTNRGYGVASAFYDTERIEVLKGPQGTLFGRSAEGGVVNTLSQKPTSTLGGYVSGQTGSFSQLGLEGAVNVPLADTLAVRVSGIRRKNDGLVHVIGNGVDYRATVENVAGGRLQVKWSPVTWFDALLAYETLDDKGTGTVPKTAPSNQSVDDSNPFTVTTAGTVQKKAIKSNRTRWEFNYSRLPFGATLSYTGGIDQTTFDTANDSTNGTQLAQFIQHEQPTTKNHELRFFTDPDKRFHIQGGGFYFFERNDPLISHLQQQSGQFNGLDLVNFLYKVETESKSLFAQADYKIIPTLKVTGGYRHNWDSVERTGNQYLRCDISGIPPGPAQAASGCVGTPPIATTPSFGIARTKKSTYHVGIDWQWSPENMLYAKWSTGFKPGGINPRTPPAVPIPYAPESLSSIELGTKNSFFGHRLTLNADVFFQNYSDYQANVPVALVVAGATGGGVYTNVGAAKINGAEIQVAWQATSYTRIDANATFLDAKFNDGPIIIQNPTNNGTVNIGGNHLPNAPSFVMVGGISHDFVLAAGRITFRIDGKHSSSFFYDLYNRPVISNKGYDTGNLSLGFKPDKGGWSVNGFVRNFTNKVVLARAAINTTTLLNTYEFQPPRTWGVQGTYRF